MVQNVVTYSLDDTHTVKTVLYTFFLAFLPINLSPFTFKGNVLIAQEILNKNQSILSRAAFKLNACIGIHHF